MSSQIVYKARPIFKSCNIYLKPERFHKPKLTLSNTVHIFFQTLIEKSFKEIRGQYLLFFEEIFAQSPKMNEVLCDMVLRQKPKADQFFK